MASTTEARPERTGEPADSDERRMPVRIDQLVLIAVVVLSLPAGAVAVFSFDANRGVTADTVSTVFFFSLVALLSSPWWPLPSLRGQSNFDRIQSMCFVWFGVTFTTHVTWELGWLVLHDSIVSSPDAPWAYIWWMYIDGGDGRYATADPTLVSQEILSVINGIVGFTGLALWWRSKGRSTTSTLLLMATAVVHLYSTALYFGSELFDGLPNVDTSSFVDLWIKFWLLNGIWLVMPWIVLYWGKRTLERQSDDL
jgi:hypothetical protein